MSSAAVEVLADLEAKSDGLEIARVLDVLRPRAVRIELGCSSLGRVMLALPAIEAVVRRFSEARFEIRAREPGLYLLREHFGPGSETHADLVVDLAPRARQGAHWDEARRSLFVPACPYPWRTQHATAHFADGATSAGFFADSARVELRLTRRTRARAVRLVREHYGIERPLIAILGRGGGFGARRFDAVAAGLADRIGAEVLDLDSLDAPIPVRAAALALCAVCVGDSGGFAHVAAAVGAPVVTVHGRACPLRHGPASRSGAAVFATCREPLRHRPLDSRQRRCLQCLEPNRVLDVAEKIAAQRWPRDRLKRFWP
jgi:hypothetical protein